MKTKIKSPQGQRRARKTQARKGKLKRVPIWYQRPAVVAHRTVRLPEGVRAYYDDKGGFQMGSSPQGKSACSRLGVNHRMVYNRSCGGYYCANPGCLANC